MHPGERVYQRRSILRRGSYERYPWTFRRGGTRNGRARPGVPRFLRAEVAAACLARRDVPGGAERRAGTGVGGRPDVRERDAEFAARGGLDIPELCQRLRTTVADAVAVFDAVTPERLAEHVAIQQYDVGVLEAIYHVVEHFSMHTGQIVFATKALTGADLVFYRHLRPAPVYREKTP